MKSLIMKSRMRLRVAVCRAANGAAAAGGGAGGGGGGGGGGRGVIWPLKHVRAIFFIKAPMVVCAFGSLRACASCFSRSL